MTNNETVEKFDFTIKLRGDGVFDIYIEGVWFDAAGTVDSALERVKSYINFTLSKTEKEKNGWWN